MKLVRFEHEGRIQVGVLHGTRVTVLPPAEAPSIEAVIDGGPDRMTAIEARVAAAECDNVDLEAVRLLAPITAPPHNVFCVGLNYQEHVQESQRLRGAEPATIAWPHFFTKTSNTITAPVGPAPLWRNVTQALDYEIELAVVIGMGGRDIPREAAMDHVFGYCVANDLSARDLQRRHGQWFKGKSLDGSLPLGPWIVTRDEIGDPSDLELVLTVNGEVRQRATVSQMIFDVPVLIAQLSAGLTLSPGDVILTGTPSGVGFAMNPPRFLSEGDEVVCTIDRIGSLRNTIVGLSS